MLVHAFAFYREFVLASDNARLMEGVMSDYTAQRQARRAAGATEE